MMSDASVFRSTTNKTVAVAAWIVAIAGAVAVTAAATAAPRRVLALVPIVLLALLAYEVFWRPRVIVRDDVVVLDDIFRTVEVPWTVVVDVDTRWALTIVTPRRRYRSSAAPAPGPMSRPRMGRDSASPRVSGDGDVRKADALGTDSGDAAYLVRAAWERLVHQERIPLGRADTDRPRVQVHWATAVACLVLAIASVPALLHA